MKIRIKGDSIRLRLTQSEVSQLGKTGLVQCSTGFPGGTEFGYSIEIILEANAISASFHQGQLTVSIPKHTAQSWVDGDLVGFDAQLEIAAGRTLSILVEKDFNCLVPREQEDESDNYSNPRASK